MAPGRLALADASLETGVLGAKSACMAAVTALVTSRPHALHVCVSLPFSPRPQLHPKGGGSRKWQNSMDKNVGDGAAHGRVETAYHLAQCYQRIQARKRDK